MMSKRSPAAPSRSAPLRLVVNLERFASVIVTIIAVGLDLPSPYPSNMARLGGSFFIWSAIF